jgi:hypothetical protein
MLWECVRGLTIFENHAFCSGSKTGSSYGREDCSGQYLGQTGATGIGSQWYVVNISQILLLWSVLVV